MDDTLPPHKPVGGGEPQPRMPGSVDGETEELSVVRPRDGPSFSKRLGPYEVEAKLGEGGMGKVYRCFDPTLKRLVAVKVLHDKYVRDPRYKARFLREAQTVASLTHPSVAQVYSVDTSDGALSIVMELVEGSSLDTLLETNGAFPVEEALGLIRQAAEGLQAAFDRGIIHRDVKPSNLLLEERGHVKIVDFGLAKDLASKNSITDDGIVLGTPHYISPEQGRGLSVDQRSDIYSLGATFYHLVTGRTPFEKKSQIAVIVAHVQDKPPAPHEIRGDLPADISLVIGRMMAQDAPSRYQTYGELLEDLESLVNGERPGHAAGTPGRFGDLYGATAPKSRLRIGLAVAAVLSIAALLLVYLAIAELEVQARPSLGNWYGRHEKLDVLNFDFSSLPEGVKLGAAFVIPESSNSGQESPALSNGTLNWTNYKDAFACPYIFNRVEEIAVYVESHAGRFDLGIQLVHPDGRARRALVLPLRPFEEQFTPLLARRNNNDVALSNEELKPLPRLVPPYAVYLAFKPIEDAVRLELRITKQQRSENLYNESYTLDGEGWNSGVVLLKSSSSRPFTISLAKVVISGVLNGDRLTEIP